MKCIFTVVRYNLITFKIFVTKRIINSQEEILHFYDAKLVKYKLKYNNFVKLVLSITDLLSSVSVLKTKYSFEIFFISRKIIKDLDIFLMFLFLIF